MAIYVKLVCFDIQPLQHRRCKIAQKSFHANSHKTRFDQKKAAPTIAETAPPTNQMELITLH